MTWDVEYTDKFDEWWRDLSESEQESLATSVRLLDADRLYDEHLEQLQRKGSR